MPLRSSEQPESNYSSADLLLRKNRPNDQVPALRQDNGHKMGWRTAGSTTRTTEIFAIRFEYRVTA